MCWWLKPGRDWDYRVYSSGPGFCSSRLREQKKIKEYLLAKKAALKTRKEMRRGLREAWVYGSEFSAIGFLCRLLKHSRLYPSFIGPSLFGTMRA